MLKRLGIVVLLVMALTPPLDMRSQAGAEALHNNCGGEPGRWVVGYGGTGNYPEMEGAEAVVRTRNGNPCDTDNNPANYVEASVRVSNDPRSQWVLSGHRLFQQLDERRIYAEFRPSDGIVRGVIGPITNVGALHTYTVGLRFSCQCLIGKYDGGDLVSSTINPDTWARPSRPDWIGKATYTVNHIPGTSSARTHFDQMRAQRQSTDAWGGSPCGMTTFNNSTLVWDQVKPACDDAEVWTMSH